MNKDTKETLRQDFYSAKNAEKFAVKNLTATVPEEEVTDSTSFFEQVEQKALEETGKATARFTYTKTLQNTSFNAAVDNIVGRSSQILNYTKVGRGYSKVTTQTKQLCKKVAPKLTERLTQKAAQKTVEKTGVKAALKTTGKVLLKKVPVVSLFAGLYYAAERICDGDWAGAAAEIASGAASCVPGVGTAASVAIDAALIGKDYLASKNEQKNSIEVNPSEYTASQTIDEPSNPMEKEPPFYANSATVAHDTQPKILAQAGVMPPNPINISKRQNSR